MVYRSRLTECGPLLCAVLLGLLARGACGQFATVINAPPDAVPPAIGADTQLNLGVGGITPVSFQAGAADGTSSNVEVNVDGGFLRDFFNANGGSVVNITNGTVAAGLQANDGSVVNIGGGFIAAGFNANAGSQVTITGGVVEDGFSANSGSNVELQDGMIAWFFSANGAVVNVAGGSIGGEFAVNDGSTVHVSGGQIGQYFSANSGSEVNISGGAVATNFTARGGSVVNISGGMVGEGAANDLRARGDSIVNVSNGAVGVVQSRDQSQLNVTGGTIAEIHASDSSEVNLMGGAVDCCLSVSVGSVLNISGGSHGDGVTVRGAANISGGSVGDAFQAHDGSSISISGAQFVLDGVDLTPSLLNNVPFLVEDRDVILSGILADGSPFAFDLNADQAPGEDFFSSSAKLAVTLIGGPILAGDFNGDGVVDAGDYTMWRDNIGRPADVLRNDVDGGTVGAAQYATWRANYGAGAVGSVAEASPSAAPEPSVLTLLYAASLPVIARRYPRGRR